MLALAALVARLGAWRGVQPLRAAAFVGLNPLVLVHVVGGAHNDGLTMLLTMLSVAALLSAREISAGAAGAGAIATKTSAALLTPFALLGAARPNRFVAGALIASAAIASAAWLAFGRDWLHGFGLAGENQSRTSYMSIPITTARLTGLDPDTTRIAAATLFLAAIACLLIWTWRGGDWIRASGWATLALLLATAWLLPWYLIWLLPLAAISRDRPLQLLTLTLTAYQLGARIPL